MRGSRRAGAGCLAGLLLVAIACSNDPYPASDANQRILYTSFRDAPKTLDPQVSYASSDQIVLANVYETLLEYHYLERPYRLIPALAEAVPEPRPLGDGRVAYDFRLRRDVHFAADPCFALDAPQGARGPDRVPRRALRASDVAFALMRIADPEVNSPVGVTFARIEGLTAFGERLTRLREDPAFAALRIDEQYRRAGPVEGLRVADPDRLGVVLSEPYPQILYWFAMPFTSPVPWEAIAWYDGRDGRPAFSEVAVGTGPFRLVRYEKRSRIVLERNPDWYGIRHPEWHAPAASFPRDGEPGDDAGGRLAPDLAGRPLPFLDRIEMRLEKEPIPAFTKFLQGYYDFSPIVKESFDQVVRGNSLSPEMAALGMRLERSVQPAVYYLGFNMIDPVVGTAAGDRGRKLRQAMSLVIDSKEFLRVFLNGRGIPAESPIPPGIFGHDPDYRNPYRQVDLPRARRLLGEAGYPDGIDPATGRPLRLSFDTGDTSVQGRLRYQFFIDAWKQLGLDVELAATNYNQFREKVRKGSYQLFMWGWIADYPDPENFLFLLWSDMSQTRSGGPNTANFSDPRYDRLFARMRTRPNDARRLALIGEMRGLLERERPWIELFYPEEYVLIHGWVHGVEPMGLSVPVWKYWSVDPGERAARRQAWNQPLRWPAWVLAALAVALLVPGVVTYLRERT